MSEVAAPAVVTAPTNQPTNQPANVPAQQTDTGAWRASLGDDIRGDATLAKYNDVGSLAKAHVELTKKLGVPTLPKPQSNWTEKEYGDLYGALGRPDKAEGYGFKPLENLPAGATYNAAQDKWFGDAAHKAGLSSAQAAGLRDAFVKMQLEQGTAAATKSQADKAAQEEGTRKLQAEYGSKWNAAIDGAQRVVNEFGSPELKEVLRSTGLHEHPAIMGFIAKIGQTLLDHSVITGIPRLSGDFNGGASQAQAELAKIDADPETGKILVTAHHPKHDALVKRRADLMRAMNPAQQ